MMDVIVTIAVIVMLCLSILSVLWLPFLIDKEREPHDGYSFLSAFAVGAMIVILVGRCLSWW